jgi:hypothetical protein
VNFRFGQTPHLRALRERPLLAGIRAFSRGYDPLTTETAFDAARRGRAGEVKPGFQTPSLALGADYILNFAGVTREDLNS